jgi:integrase
MGAYWDDKQKKWRLHVRVDGIAKSFVSRKPGRKGLKEVNQRYENWLLNNSSSVELTVKQLSEQYLEDMKARLGDKSESYKQNEQYLRLYVLPKLGTYKIRKITLRQWQNLLNEATGVNKPLAKKTLMNLRGIITSLVKYGYQNYQCELLRGSLSIPKGHSQKEKEILQPDEIRRLLEPSDLWYWPVFCFLIYTGMRPGEALGLKVEDIQGSSIRIRRAINYSGTITEGKNANARREVPIGPTARQILYDTIQRNKDNKLDTEWVFCSHDGGHGNQSTMNNHWLKLKRERDLSSTVYGLRHTFISLMKHYMPESRIKDIVGHSASMPTYDGTYSHIVDGESLKSAAIIDSTLKSIAE